MAKLKEYRAKLVPVVGNHQRLRLVSDMGYEISLVKGGPKRAYLWIGGEDGFNHDTISGEEVLRALAKAILAELDAKN